MNRPIYFCKSWFRAKKKPTEVWTEAQARSAHQAGTLYTVLVDSPDQPFCFLEINGGYVGVGFLDELLRETLYYAFKQVEPGRMFLNMATYREFDGDTDTVLAGTTYVFDPDGTVKIQKQQFRPHSVETAESTTDIAANFERWPEFGEYEQFLKVERQA
jgi:hypothetical protein